MLLFKAKDLMATLAMFHEVGTLNNTQVFLEKYSRSLFCLTRSESAPLSKDCDRNVTVSNKVENFLHESRLSQKSIRTFNKKDLYKRRGLELTLIVTDYCNFACPYCFASDLYPGSKTLKPEEIVYHIRSFLNSSDIRISSLIFFGGEPLLAFKAIKLAWSEIQALFNDHQGEMPSLAIVTNGSLITDDIAKFLAENDFAVTVSLDGPKTIHDLCRPIKRGRGSYEQVVKGINALSKAGAFYSIEATYTSKHLELGIEVLDIVDHALELNAQEVHVMPAFPEQASGINEIENAYVASLFKVAATRAAKNYLTEGAMELAYVSRLIYAFAHDRKRHYICTAGIDKFSVMSNGDIVPCYLVCDSPHKIASCSEEAKSKLNNFPLKDAIPKYRTLVRNNLPECSGCWASDWCFACYGPRYARDRSLGAPGGLECEIYKAMIEATFLECAKFLANRSGKVSG